MSTSFLQSQKTQSMAVAYAFAMTLALGAATSFAVARAGAIRGLGPADMIL